MIKWISISILLLTQVVLAETVTTYTQVNKPLLTYWQAATLGTIQGITEFLPVSSTGHLILANRILHLDSADNIIQSNEGDYTAKNALDAYAIIIQGGTILAVLLLYWKRILSIIYGLIGRDSKGRRLGRNLLLAFLPAACMGLILGNWIEKHLFNPPMVMIALVAGSILMFGAEKLKSILYKAHKSKEIDLENLSKVQCLTIGGLQCLALWPGTSRSMITIVGGYLAGLSRQQAAEFSFLLGLVTLTAASSYKLITEGHTMIQVLSLGPAIFGCAIAFMTGAIAIRWLINYLSKHGLSLFAWYRLVLAFVIFWVIYF